MSSRCGFEAQARVPINLEGKMKLYIYKGLTHGVSFYTVEQQAMEVNFLGTIEVTGPKKIVKKEVRSNFVEPRANGYNEIRFVIPVYAENVKLTYEVEE
jgi:hypothetical protein